MQTFAGGVTGTQADVDSDPRWLAARLASVCMNLDFDGFVEVAVRLIADDLEATAVLRALDDGAAHQHDEFSVAARRLRLAQYAGMWSAPRRAAPVLEIDPR